MFAVSKSLVAVCPLTPSGVENAIVYVYNTSSNSCSQFIIPTSYNNAIPLSKHVTEWWEDSSDYEDPNDKARLLAITEKKARTSTVIHDIIFTGDENYLCVTLDSHLFLFYHVQTGELINVIPFDRKCGLQSITIDHKNLLISDSVGDIYAVGISHLINGGVVPTLIYSHGCLLSHISTIDLNTRKVIISGDTEHKIRVSNHPHFFNIQSFCYGLPATPYTLVSLQESPYDINHNGNRVYTLTSSFSGYIRSNVSDPNSPFLPVHPASTVTLVHDPETGQVISNTLTTKHYQFSTFSDDSATSIFSSAYLGSTQSSDTQFVWFLPSNVKCAVNERGVSNPSQLILSRSTVQQSLFIRACLPTSEKQERIQLDQATSIEIHFDDDVKEFTDAKIVAIKQSSPQSSTIYALTETNVVLVFESAVSEQASVTLRCLRAISIGIPSAWGDFQPSSLATPQQESLARDSNIHFKLLRDERHFKENDEYLERKREKIAKKTKGSAQATEIVQLDAASN